VENRGGVEVFTQDSRVQEIHVEGVEKGRGPFMVGKLFKITETQHRRGGGAFLGLPIQVLPNDVRLRKVVWEEVS